MTDASLPVNLLYVVDGGCLLHRVRWQKGTALSTSLTSYVLYVKCHFKASATVVFDGYGNGANVNDHEHMGRLGKVLRIAPEIHL